MRRKGLFQPARDQSLMDVVGLLKACATQKDLERGCKVHAYIREHKFEEKNTYIGSTLVHMYAKCGALAKAEEVLKELPVRDVVAWSALIAGYIQQGQGEKALNCYDSMLCEGHTPNAVTFTCVLRACGITGAIAKAEEIYYTIVSLGMLEKDIMLGNTLVDMYVKYCALDKAQQVFKGLPVRNMVTWTTLIAGYAQQGQGEEALKCYDGMQCEGYIPNAVTFTCALKACGRLGATDKGKEIHDKIVSLGLLEKDIVLGNTLLDMYVKCGALVKAQEVFKALSVRNVVTWSTLIAGYVQQGQGEEALNCYDSMLCEGHLPDAVTFICALKACGSIGAAARGQDIHDKVVALENVEKDVVLGSALVNMYFKCSALEKALEVLEILSSWDLVLWSTLIEGYAEQGLSSEALNCFERMQSKGVKPDSTTLITVLKACDHSGLLDEAETYFYGMSTEYGIQPDLEHYCCMVDVFGRVGKFNKALWVINWMPSDEYLPLWVALMGACCKSGELKIGRLAFNRALHLGKHNDAVYVLMRNSYTAAGMHEDI